MQDRRTSGSESQLKETSFSKISELLLKMGSLYCEHASKVDLSFSHNVKMYSKKWIEFIRKSKIIVVLVWGFGVLGLNNKSK